MVEMGWSWQDYSEAPAEMVDEIEVRLWARAKVEREQRKKDQVNRGGRR